MNVQRAAVVLAAISILAVLAAGPATAFAEPAACPAADQPEAGLSDAAVRSATYCLVNAARAERGLATLAPSWRLAQAARRHAADMVTRHFFDHVSPEGDDVQWRTGRTGYLRTADRWVLGENIGWAEPSASTPRSLVDAWMASRTHRAVILGQHFREIGVGAVAATPFADSGPGATFVMNVGVTR